jgi:hypothetical protein
VPRSSFPFPTHHPKGRAPGFNERELNEREVIEAMTHDACNEAQTALYALLAGLPAWSMSREAKLCP